MPEFYTNKHQPLPIQSVADQVATLVQFASEEECRLDDGETNWDLVALKMGMSRDELDKFRDLNGYLIATANQLMIQAHPPTPPPTDAELIIPLTPTKEQLSSDPSDQALALAVSTADSNIAAGLKTLGLTDKEMDIAVSLQAFNKEHFKESMDMVSSSVLVTTLKLGTQQREIEARLEFVREQIKSFGQINSKEREEWVKEERLLVVQYVEIGDLLKSIQDTWYRGAAYLAVVRAKLRKEPGMMRTIPSDRTQRSNKPSFRPNGSFMNDSLTPPTSLQ